MAWVLIVCLTAYGTDGGNALTTAQFATREACEAAGRDATELVKGAPYGRRVAYRCAATG